jgi:DNA polymerase-3 subunit gamma/tau
LATETHRVLALKWRPQKFSDVVGQAHVIRTLTNALAQGKVAHAYLFAGPRGVGKTTCARIMARAVNCEKGAGPDPCGECSTCKEITTGRCLDVIEIDAASSGKAEDVRDLREVVRFAPARARRKVFIIDEVHSMSAQGYNALLKTLEEPPAHVMFILATTDAHKVPATIHSRCQRFDFHPLGPATVSGHLKLIAKAEGIKADDASLALIAKAARGAMRDAQMLLEQAAAYAPGELSSALVRDLLGLVESEWVERFLVVMRDRDVAAGLKLVDELIESGRSPGELLEEVQEEIRDALMKTLGAEVSMQSLGFLSAPERSGWFTSEELLSLLAHVKRAIEEISLRQITHPRIAAELAVARLLRRERALGWEEVEEQIAKLESVLKDPGASPARMPAPVLPAASASPAAAFSVSPPASAPGVAASAGRTSPMTLPDIARHWPGVLDRVKGADAAAMAYLKSTRCAGLTGNALILEVASQFHRDGLASPEIRASVEAALSDLAGQPVAIDVREGAAQESDDREGPRPGSAGPKTQAAWAPGAGGASARPTSASAPGAGGASARPTFAPAPGAGGASARPTFAPAPGSAPAIPARPASVTPEWVEQEPLVKAALDVFKARIVGLKRP